MEMSYGNIFRTLISCLSVIGAAFIFFVPVKVSAQYETDTGYFSENGGYTAAWSPDSTFSNDGNYYNSEFGGPISYYNDGFYETSGESYTDQNSWTGVSWENGFSETEESWSTQILPQGLIYPSYLAGRKEPRLQSIFTYDSDYGWLWDIALGGRVPLFRYGTEDPVEPEGFQIDMEGAALLRLDFERQRQLAATDYRAGLPITYGTKFWQLKTGYYHVSSHLGDNYLIDEFKPKVHYVRDEILLGLSLKPISAVRIYGEVGWAFNTGETTEPWECQFGAEYSPVYEQETAKLGAPFVAVCGHLFEELDFSGYFNSQIGWQWRKSDNGRLRIGAEFYCGCDDQFQFHNSYQKKIGAGFWYDF